MGSEFEGLVSPEQAAKMLGRSRRTVTTYMKNGVLNKTVKERRTYLFKSEVEQLQMDLGVGFPAMNKKTFYSLQAHIQRLELDIAVLKKATGFFDSPLRPSSEEMVRLHYAAVQAKAAGAWSLEEIQMWAGMFERMDDVFFDSLGALIEVRDAWRPFYELCLAQAKQVSTGLEFKTSLRLQHLYSLLQSGLMQMR